MNFPTLYEYDYRGERVKPDDLRLSIYLGDGIDTDSEASYRRWSISFLSQFWNAMTPFWMVHYCSAGCREQSRCFCCDASLEKLSYGELRLSACYFIQADVS